MNLYLISVNPQDLEQQWDVYLSAVVVANSEQEAKNIHPSYTTDLEHNREYLDSAIWFTDRDFCWVPSLEMVIVKYLGTAAPEYLEKQVIVSNYIGS
jgi:hypothetical protein